jgi:phytoene synthase
MSRVGDVHPAAVAGPGRGSDGAAGLSEAYHVCRGMTARAARNFHYGIRLLPWPKRQGLYAVYAWSRVCDDAVDESAGDDARQGLARARGLLRRACGEGFQTDADPVVRALGDTIRRFALPVEPFEALLAGMEMDVDGRLYRSFDDLRLYCERVAGAVGRLCVEVFGYTDPSARLLAVDMGVALQLTNILRDLDEDVARGRIYLPLSEMEEEGYSADDLRRRLHTPAFARLMTRQADRALSYYARSERLFPLVSPDARACPMVLHAVYRELLARIAALGYDVFGRRVRVPLSRKLGLVGSVLWRQRRVRAGHG